MSVRLSVEDVGFKGSYGRLGTLFAHVRHDVPFRQRHDLRAPNIDFA
jgi:hypothetical protein